MQITTYPRYGLGSFSEGTIAQPPEVDCGTGHLGPPRSLDRSARPAAAASAKSLSSNLVFFCFSPRGPPTDRSRRGRRRRAPNRQLPPSQSPLHRRKRRRIDTLKRIALRVDFAQAVIPAANRGILADRQFRHVVKRQECRHPEVAIRNRVTREPRARAKLGLQQHRASVEIRQTLLDHSLFGRADRVSLLRASFEVHNVARTHEILFAPTDPADHVRLAIARSPEIRTGGAGEPARYRVGLPQAPSVLDQYGYRKVGIERPISLGLSGRERGCMLIFDIDLQIARDGNRKAGVGIAAEEQFHRRHKRD